MIRQHLALDVIDIAQHPKFGNAPVAYREERGTAPLDGAAASFDTEEFFPMGAVEQHLGGGAVLRRDQLFDGAGEIADRRMHRPQIDDETVRPAQLRPERGAEDEISIEDIAGDAFVGAVPDLPVKTLDKLLRC